MKTLNDHAKQLLDREREIKLHRQAIGLLHFLIYPLLKKYETNGDVFELCFGDDGQVEIVNIKLSLPSSVLIAKLEYFTDKPRCTFHRHHAGLELAFREKGFDIVILDG